LISQGVPPLGGVKQVRGGKNNLFSSRMRQYSTRQMALTAAALLQTSC